MCQFLHVYLDAEGRERIESPQCL